MQGPPVDLVLLTLLVLFFGIQQRHRPQLFFRFWFTGWILVFLSLLVWEPRFTNATVRWVQETLRLELMLLGGITFVLSFIMKQGKVRRMLMYGAAASVPMCAAFAVSMMTMPPYWALAILIIASESVAVALPLVFLPARWGRRRTLLSAASAASGVILLALCRWNDHGNDLSSWVMVQILLFAAFLYAEASVPRSASGFAGTLGFSLWALGYAASSTLTDSPRVLKVMYDFWHLPKYCVALAMILYIFEDSQRETVQLAERNRFLYEDFRLLYMDHPHPMWIYDPVSLRFLSANSAAMARYGYTLEEFLRMKVNDICAPQEVALALTSFPEGHQQQDVPTLHRDKSGETMAVEVTDHEILYQGREARFVLAVDITDREKLNQELAYRAHHDALTGLPNRRTLEDRIVQCLARSVRDCTRAVMFTIDIDRFKLINDTYGHLVGDECLKAVSKRLQSRIRQIDTIARTGGEEFTAIIGGVKKLEDAEKIASMLQKLFDTPLSLTALDIKVSISIGAAIYPDDSELPEVLRRKSDQALYHAKRTGRNRYVFASPAVCAVFDQASDVERALRSALEDDGFSLVYQPIFNKEGYATQFEALLRMKEWVPARFEPSMFIPIAEDTGLIVAIGTWTIREVCRQLVWWREHHGQQCTVAINISCRQLLRRSFVEQVLETLREFDLPPESLQLELTETTLMTEPQQVVEAMVELANAGLSFAIDDFGTGYSSLARLADLPISMLKMDRTFVAQLSRRENTNGIVTAIVQMAQTMRVEVVAEGVENAEQLAILRELGCNYFQGYFLSRPCQPEEISIMLDEYRGIPTMHPEFAVRQVGIVSAA